MTWPNKGCRAAALDRRHHLELVEADMAGIGPAPRRAVAAEDVRDLQRWTRHKEPRVGDPQARIDESVELAKQ
jgi:hypothetical protein